MYNVARINRVEKPRINMGIIVLLVGILIFFGRFISVLATNTERGGFAYVQLLNFGMPLVESQVYDEGDYVENDMSFKAVCLEALGLSNISSLGIVNNEVAFFKQGLDVSGGSTMVSINPFQVREDAISKIEVVADGGARDPSLKKALNNAKPEVLIYHTHTMENYSEASTDTSDPNASVVGVGEELKKELEYYGISTIHDKTNYSVVYTGAYAKSNEGLKKYLAEYGDFKYVIDLHRDSAAKSTSTATVNGEDVARFMFVTAQNSTNYDKNLALTNRLYDKANTLYPGLMRPKLEYDRALCAKNLQLSDNSLLIECGSNTNSGVEARATAKYIARILAEELNR